ncbi:MAG TPA: hypothetical protein VGM77_01055 [Gemmatimonadales bacterium]|jgi:hypothetical protein
MLKKPLAGLMVRTQLQRLLTDPSPYNRLWGHAALMQFGTIGEEAFREYLDGFYAGLDPVACSTTVDLPAKRVHLDRPGGYKVDVASLHGDVSAAEPKGRFDFWARRFGLLRYLGIRSDVLILRAGDQVPPHGHSQVVSGFYLLEGEVAVRHYDRVEEFADHVMLRKAIDTVMGPGGYTTNSEYCRNVHWLLGIAPTSYLFRFTVTDVPVRSFNAPAHHSDRAYVDPTVPPDASGLIPAPYITSAAAKQVLFVR